MYKKNEHRTKQTEATKAHIQACQRTFKYISSLYEISRKKNLNTIGSQHLVKIYLYLETVVILDQVRFLAQLGHVCRSLLETVVDLELLKENNSLKDKLVTWEHSSKLDSAQKCINIFNLNHPLYESWSVFIEKNQQKIIEAREKYFYTNKHPQRWTKNNLRKDCKIADSTFQDPLCKELIQLGRLNSSLEEFYVRLNPRLCEYTHGSGFSYLRNQTSETVEIQYVLLLKNIIILSLIAIRIIFIMEDPGAVCKSRFMTIFKEVKLKLSNSTGLL